MNKTTKFAILGAVLVGMLVLLYVMSGSGEKDGDKKEGGKKASKKENKDSTVVKMPVNPSGTYLLYQLLAGYEVTRSLQKIQTSEGGSNLESALPKTSLNGLPNTYFSISELQDLDYDDTEYLLSFVAEGNQAFIAAEDLSSDLNSAIFGYGNYVFSRFYDTTVSINFYHPEYRQPTNLTLKNPEMNSHGAPVYKNWSTFNSYSLNDEVIRVAYDDEQRPVCLMVPYGDGQFLIHAMPDAFSNINMLKNVGKVHAESVLSHLNRSNIYWHQNFGKYSPYRGTPQPTRASAPPPPKEYPKTSPLQYIMRQPALFAALLLLISGVLLYMIFHSKRRQRIIPAIQSNENSSLEFVETVSKLYFQQKRHDKLIAHKEHIFLSFIRHRYYVSSPTINMEFVTKISGKSGIDEEEVKTIFKLFKHGKASRSIGDDFLIKLYNKLDHFYKNCN